MATPAVTPSAPAAPSSPAPSAPAPSSPAPSAPSSTPPASPTPAAPASEPASSPATPVPAAPSAPYDPKTASAPPKAADYPVTPEGQARYVTDHNRWHQNHPDGEKPAEGAPQQQVPPPDAAKTPEQQALEDAQKPEGQQQAPPEQQQQPEAAATPQSLAEMRESDPEFWKALEASPKAKGQIFSMARELAAAKPVMEIFPSVDDAKFAQEYATSMVGLKTASMRLIDNPDDAGSFLSMFDSQFAKLDGEGNPVMENGKPVYDADRDIVRNAIFSSRLDEVREPITGQINDLKAKLAGAYPSDFARNQDQQKLDNLEYAQLAIGVLDQILDGSFFESAPPEPPADATPEQRQWFENQKAELNRQRQELEDKKRGASKEERTAARAQFESNVRNDMGASVATVIGNAIKAATDGGIYIPAFYLQEKHIDPKTGTETKTPAIAVRLFTQFENELMRPGSKTLMEITQHELLPQNDQTLEIRKAYYARKASEMMPGLVQKEIDRIQNLVKLDQDQQAELTRKRNQAAQPEPATGGSALPQGASREQILQAAEEAAKKFAADQGVDWSSLTGSEKQARILTQNHRLNRK